MVEKDIKNILGIDLVVDNIYNKTNGACVRKEGVIRKFKHLNPKINFMVGDITKNIKKGDCFSINKSSYAKYTKKVEEGSNILGNNSFKVISMMFAVHYMYKNKKMLSGLVDNIRENIKNNGYFIGCCLDGHKILIY